MRTFDEVIADADPRPAFSNGTSWDIWSYDWCRLCVNDVREDCPLILAAMLGTVPREWYNVGLQQYECVEFEPQEVPNVDVP